MPRQGRRKRKGNRRNRSVNQPSKQLNVLKSIDIAQQTQIRAMLPRIPDPKQIHLGRHKVYTFVKNIQLNPIYINASVDQASAYSFSLSSLPESGSFSTIFDTYYIQQISVTLLPQNPQMSMPPILTVIDYDDANVLTSLAQGLDYDTSQVTQPGQLVQRVFSPKVGAAVYSGAFTSFAQMHPWIDAGSPNVQHYGLKTYFPAFPGATSNIAYAVIASIVIQFKYTR